MAGTYYAITRRQTEWVYVCSGPDPAQVYHDALDILNGRPDTHDTDPVPLSPVTELSLDNLRVVPETVARQTYQVSFVVAGVDDMQ